MKKSIIALSVTAALSSAAQAQNVSITGIMDAMYLSGKHFGQGYKEMCQSGARTTSVQILGSEDLGGGLRASFRFEVQPLLVAGDGNGYNTQAAAGQTAGTIVGNQTAQTTGQASVQSGLVGKGYSFVGLSGGFGSIEVGTINSPSFRTFALASGGLGTGIGSGYGITIGSTATNTFTRFENSVMYQTPTISGFQAQVLTSLGNDSQFGSSTGLLLRRQKVNDMAVAYSAGPLSIRGSVLSRKNSPNEVGTATASAPVAANLETTTTTIAASYDLGFARIGAMTSNIKDDGGLTSGGLTGKTASEASAINVIAPFGAVRLLANYTQRTTNESPVTALEGRKSTITGVAAEYTLSKRTFLYARYETGKRNDLHASTVYTNGAAGTGGTAVTDGRVARTGLGISHQF